VTAVRTTSTVARESLADDSCRSSRPPANARRLLATLQTALERVVSPLVVEQAE